jgi:hypothetical protein
VNQFVIMTLMYDARVTLDDVIFSDFALQANRDAQSEIAADKKQWCEDVWESFGANGKIERVCLLSPWPLSPPRPMQPHYGPTRPTRPLQIHLGEVTAGSVGQRLWPLPKPTCTCRAI